MSDTSNQRVAPSQSDTAVGDTELPPAEEEGWQGEPPQPAADASEQTHAEQTEDRTATDRQPSLDEVQGRSTSDTEPGLDEAGGLAPGQAREDPVAALWGDSSVKDFREQWRELQLRFVDDPREAVCSAQALVDSAVRSLTTTLLRQQQDLDSWKERDSEDTEVLRVALRRYREFLDRILGV
jgi:hypothetical protein